MKCALLTPHVTSAHISLQLYSGLYGLKFFYFWLLLRSSTCNSLIYCFFYKFYGSSICEWEGNERSFGKRGMKKERGGGEGRGECFIEPQTYSLSDRYNIYTVHLLLVLSFFIVMTSEVIVKTHLPM